MLDSLRIEANQLRGKLAEARHEIERLRAGLREIREECNAYTCAPYGEARLVDEIIGIARRLLGEETK